MDDLISKQAAIDLWDKYHPYIATKAMAYDRELRALPPAQPEQRWILCSERLPDEKDAVILKKLGIEKISEDVLATVEVKGERMTVTARTYDGKWNWDMKYTFPDFKVVAWQPLPEPYREEGEKHEGSD